MQPVSGLTWATILTNDQAARLLDEVCALVRDLERMPEVNDLFANVPLNPHAHYSVAHPNVRIELTPDGLRTTAEGLSGTDNEEDPYPRWRDVEPRPTNEDELRSVVWDHKIDSRWPLDIMERIAR
jgi:hypothetical protein